jgi:hypothetical protein
VPDALSCWRGSSYIGYHKLYWPESLRPYSTRFPLSHCYNRVSNTLTDTFAYAVASKVIPSHKLLRINSVAWSDLRHPLRSIISISVACSLFLLDQSLCSGAELLYHCDYNRTIKFQW